MAGTCTCLFEHPRTQRDRLVLERMHGVQTLLAKDGETPEIRHAAKNAAAVLYVRLYTPCTTLGAVFPVLH